MYRKWLFSLLFITLLFFGLHWILPIARTSGYIWITMSMAVISFIYFFMVTNSSKKESTEVVGGNLAVIVIKFILSATIIIFYVLFSKKTESIDFVWFFGAYGIYSIVNYPFAYFYTNEEKH